uniref:JHL05D22.3 protein n=1 Tax=Rhizophora mucronata TaxID=61149 RepID=A0A2P2L0L6_RHIMU
MHDNSKEPTHKTELVKQNHLPGTFSGSKVKNSPLLLSLCLRLQSKPNCRGLDWHIIAAQLTFRLQNGNNRSSQSPPTLNLTASD